MQQGETQGGAYDSNASAPSQYNYLGAPPLGGPQAAPQPFGGAPYDYNMDTNYNSYNNPQNPYPNSTQQSNRPYSSGNDGPAKSYGPFTATGHHPPSSYQGTSYITFESDKDYRLLVSKVR